MFAVKLPAFVSSGRHNKTFVLEGTHWLGPGRILRGVAIIYNFLSHASSVGNVEEEHGQREWLEICAMLLRDDS